MDHGEEDVEEFDLDDHPMTQTDPDRNRSRDLPSPPASPPPRAKAFASSPVRAKKPTISAAAAPGATPPHVKVVKEVS